MLWSNGTNAGFSDGYISFKVHPEYKDLNVEVNIIVNHCDD